MSRSPSNQQRQRIPLVSLDDAAFGYAGRPFVEHVSFSQRAGEVVALLGPNGSGKSTLVKGILGLAEQLGGTAELFGMPRASFRERSRIGYVPQRQALSSSVRVTVSEVVATGRIVLRPWWRPTSNTDRRAITEAIAAVGLTGQADNPVGELSGGQQRRALIARALTSHPELLVMDEPTAGVDAEAADALAMVLAELASRGTSMLIVTHELAPLRAIVTRSVTMNSGRIVATS